MGAASSEEDGVKCQSCKCKLPPNHFAFDVYPSPQHGSVFGFFESSQATWEIDFKPDGQEQYVKMRVESGNKLYRYFRLEDQPPPYHYFCSKCMVERYPGDMKRVNKAVIGKAYMMDSTPKLTVELQKALYRLGNDPK